MYASSRQEVLDLDEPLDVLLFHKGRTQRGSTPGVNYAGSNNDDPASQCSQAPSEYTEEGRGEDHSKYPQERRGKDHSKHSQERRGKDHSKHSEERWREEESDSPYTHEERREVGVSIPHGHTGIVSIDPAKESPEALPLTSDRGRPGFTI